MKKRLALFLIVLAAIPILVFESNAQNDPVLSRWVFGAGGTVNVTNGDTYMNSILGQTAIFTLDGGTGNNVLHQGFWVNDDPPTDVDDQPITLSPDLINYPNPFSYTTTIRYILPTPGFATIKIFDMVGRVRKSMALGKQTSGHQEVVWDGKDDEGLDCASGSYMYELNVNAYQSYGSSPKNDLNLRNVMVIVR